jgi:hypothetical protein
MRYVDLAGCHYIGVDVVPSLVAANQKNYGNEVRQFIHANISKDALVKADLIMCRDCLVHLSFDDIKAVLLNFKKSGATYLLTTTFPDHINKNIKTGQWRALNLQHPPFNFPAPLLLINEQCPENTYGDKSVALWRLEDVVL